MIYNVEFICTYPEYADVELEATNEAEARIEARKEFDLCYPDAGDISIVKVSTVQ